MIDVSDDQFEALVDRAFERIPQGLIDLVDNCIVTIENEPPVGEDLLGLYEGTALTERDDYAGVLPDVITLYQGPLTRLADSLEELEEEVFVTVVHEIAHHFGIDDEKLHELDWA
ncbi:metallopeptidase family protein [Scrofimicrobium canadense]|uniref:metallopeptidase family protein n=1 Tax=Scrofimicrobium canadense TaxID=2652290 RepID=UPI00298DCA07|nr:metallopeptidase family protein [Scrofimicrobium canadense]